MLDPQTAGMHLEHASKFAFWSLRVPTPLLPEQQKSLRFSRQPIESLKSKEKEGKARTNKESFNGLVVNRGDQS